MEKNGISIVVPCFNQASALAENLGIITSCFQSLQLPFEIIAVNDGSTDATPSVLDEAKLQGVRVYTHTKNLGKGKAVQTGVLAAQYPVTLFLDADLAIPIQETQKFLEALEEDPNLDIAIASRFVPGHTTLVPVLPHRKLFEKVFRLLRKVIIGIEDIQDTQCGFKMFRTKKVQEIFRLMTCNRFSFDAELLFIAHQWGLSIKELPVALQNPPVSSIRLGRDSLQMFFDLFKIRWHNALGWYQKPRFQTANITLDDFGINDVVTERILHALSHPQVKRIAVMVDGDISQEAVQKLLESGKKIDIHLELPGAGGEREAHGNFFERIVQFLDAFFSGAYSRERIKKSFHFQIDEFYKLFGRYPDGINSHEHIHFFPLFYDLVLKLSYHYKIPYVRLGRRASFCFHPVAIVLLLLRSINSIFIGKPKSTSLTLFSFDWGVHPKWSAQEQSEILYHVERDEEWVYLFVSQRIDEAS